jgi:hypothetical protein
MKHMIIENGEPRVGDFPGTLDDIKRTVGGPVACVAEYSSDTREDIQLAVYCNEEGRALGMEPNVYTDINGVLLFGPVVVIGTNDTGKPVGLTDEEIAQVSIARSPDSPLPVLNIIAEDVTFW